MSSVYLFVARYSFSADHKQVLLFKEGDQFLHIPSLSSNPNWALCVDMKGKIGFVPYTYVSNKQIPNHELLWIIDDLLEKLHSDTTDNTSKLTRDVLKVLSVQRTELLSSTNVLKNGHEGPEKCEESDHKNSFSSKRKPESSVPNDTVQQNSDKALNSEPDSEVNIVKEASSAKSNKIIESQSCDSILKIVHSSTQTDENDSNVPSWLIPSLIEGVRHKTQLSHENSKVAINVMLDTFKDALPQFNTIWCQLKRNLKDEVVQEDVDNVVHSEDKRKLMDIFKQLWYCKNDEQQRSWPVHEDEDHISSLLVDLNNILMDANPRISREVVQCHDYEMVNLLATYYQMEPRKALRIKMLYVFLTLCELDLTVITHLLNSVLPMELARDIQDNFEDEEKVQNSACLLTVIFSTGERPPTGTYDFINKKFLHFLFEKFEELAKDGEEDIGDSLLSIILAFNLHFQDGQVNLVLETLKGQQCAQYLTERLVFLINREDDPTKALCPDVESPNSVLKFMVDFFSIPMLVDLFYLNDVKVLLDIIVRQLSDLLPGEKKRLEYLCLVRNLLRNSNYSEHMHQIEGLQKCFRTIVAQEVPDEDEVTLVLGIYKEFPSWFQEQ